MNQKQEEQHEGGVTVKRRRLYTILVAACALILVGAIVLTVLLTVGGGGSMNEPVGEQPGNTQTPQEDTDKDPDEQPGDDDDDEPTATEIVFSLPVADASVTTSYEFWHNTTLDRYSLHTGIDFSAEAGTSVTAAYGGTVESITETLLEGGRIVIDHGNGLKTVYASVDVDGSLHVGDAIAKGDVIGTVSAAADAMGNEYDLGSHLHFEVHKDGAAIDPDVYLDIDEK